MSVHLRYEQTCVVHACLRPAREAGGYCRDHFLGLSAAQRAEVQAFQGGPRQVAELEELFALPAVEPERRA